jgi:hypothetical protein
MVVDFPKTEMKQFSPATTDSACMVFQHFDVPSYTAIM